MRGSSIVVTVLVAVGCQTSRDDVRTVSASTNDLGITEVAISHSMLLNGDSLLVIRGLGADGEELASATVRTGAVLFTNELDDQIATHGRDVELAVGTTTYTEILPDFARHQIPDELVPALTSFVRLSAVATELDHSANIVFTPRSTEAAFTAQNCSGQNFPTNKGNPTECCFDTGLTPWQIVMRIAGGSNDGKIGIRAHTDAGQGIVCRQSDGISTGCTTDCNYGPCGASSAWQVLGATGWTDYVFHPTTTPYQNRCGYDAYPVSYFPERYNGNQTLYPSVTATCTCTSCNSDGTPSPAGCVY